jgi:hypothetical protein
MLSLYLAYLVDYIVPHAKDCLFARDIARMAPHLAMAKRPWWFCSSISEPHPINLRWTGPLLHNLLIMSNPVVMMTNFSDQISLFLEASF